MDEMVQKQILPAVVKYANDLAVSAVSKKALVSGLACSYESETVAKLSALSDSIAQKVAVLEADIERTKSMEDVIELSSFIGKTLLADMESLRADCDAAEMLTSEEYWPFPTYGKLLFSVR